MATAIIDTLKLAGEFIQAGIEEKAARVLADKFGQLANEQLVTREYLDFKLNELRNEFRSEIKELKYHITLGLGGWIVAVLTFFKFMDKFF
jgi:hypothetical protein